MLSHAFFCAARLHADTSDSMRKAGAGLMTGMLALLADGERRAAEAVAASVGALDMEGVGRLWRRERAEG
jgi:hypothetical protein